MRSIWDLANPQLRDLVVYEPGKPIAETARELNADPAEIVKLASNENPLGPSPKALEAMRRELETAQLYPDGGGFYLRSALADKLRLKRENIILGNGSNEIIEFLCHAFIKSGDDIVTPQYAFIAYKLAATLLGARTIEVFASDFEQDLNAMVEAITHRTRLLFVANPNNPTGSLIPQEKIDTFVSKVPEDVVIVFDEAYFEFLDNPPNTIRYIRSRRNLVVVRTFSKIHGLAGLRVGYGIADPELIEVLEKAREPFNVNSIGQTGALFALQDQEHQEKTKRLVDEGRVYLEKQFGALGLRFVPGAANFVMVNVGDGPAVFRKLLEKKVIIRPLRGYGLPEWVRISVGTMSQNEKCIAALKETLDLGSVR